MDRRRREKIEAIYQDALDLPASERTAFVAHECGDDDKLREAVTELLAHYDAAQKEFGADDQLGAVPDTIGPFRVLEVLGEGGMGTVYLAEQSEPIRRKVALKVVKPGMDSRQVLARFQVERQALAVMDHPGIARVFEAGATADARPFFAMEYVPGVSITRYCDDHRLPTRERIALFIEVCRAIQYAHHKGVIHRDIKPHNVIVTEQDGKPIPKVIDFGIAKAIEGDASFAATFTRDGMLIGTPEYMSPEQAAMSDIDARADVYALGLLLYELLAGSPPFDAEAFRREGLEAVMQMIRDAEPPRPSTRVETSGDIAAAVARKRRTEPRSLARLLKGDLDLIVMKAIEKDRDRRYGTPSELATDLSRHLSNEPVSARPPSATYRLRKFARRHRLGVGVGAVAVLSLVAVSVLTAVQSRRVAAERDRADREAHVSREVSDYLSDVFHEVTLAHGRTDSIRLKEAIYKGVSNLDDEKHADLSVDAQVEILRVFGDAHSNMGHLDAAMMAIRRSVDLAEDRFGDDHLETAESRYHLFALLYQQGNAEAAIDIGERILPVFERELGPDHRLTQRCLRYLGVACTDAGRDADAVEFLERLRPAYERTLGSSHPRVAMLLREIATAFGNMGEYGKSVDVARESLALLEIHYGSGHAFTTLSLKTLASSLRLAGEPEEALEVENREIAALRQSYGDEFAGLIGAYDLQGWILNDLGRTDEARVAFSTALTYENSNERKHVVDPLHGLAVIEHGAGNLDEARRYIERALEIVQSLHDPRHLQAVVLMTELGAIELDDGNIAAADSLLSFAHATALERLPEVHHTVANARHVRGRCLLAQGRFDEAEAMLLAAKASYTELLGAAAPRTEGVNLSIAALYQARDKAGRPGSTPRR